MPKVGIRIETAGDGGVLTHWIKERIMECEWKDPAYTETVHRVHYRFRSDGSMWYQVVRRGGPYDLHPELLEARFSDYLKREPKQYGARTGYSEADFDTDFEERMQRMNGKEVPLKSEVKQ